MTSEICQQIFRQCIHDYHMDDDVDTAVNNPFPPQSIEAVLYLKCWIDTVQWHLEDIIRDPQIDSVTALQIKRRIDASNQQRTDRVEEIDNWFSEQFKNVVLLPSAIVNTESPAWAIDRLSILELKIYHMTIEAERKEASVEHRQRCYDKLVILLEQKNDLSLSINQLLTDLSTGQKKMKVYRQMKMYNDESLNPVLYHQKAAGE